jgi:hypothetical protein
VLLSVNRVGQRTTEHRAASSPPDDLKAIECSGGDRRGRAGKSCHTATWVGKKTASDQRCAGCRTISQQSWGSTPDGSLSVLAKLSSQVRSSDEGVPLTHDRGVCGSGNRSHSRPARVPARCGQARPLDTGPLRLLRTTPVTCGITIPSTKRPRRCSLEEFLPGAYTSLLGTRHRRCAFASCFPSSLCYIHVHCPAAVAS